MFAVVVILPAALITPGAVKSPASLKNRLPPLVCKRIPLPRLNWLTIATCSPPKLAAGKLMKPSPEPLPSMFKAPLLSPAMFPGTNKVPSVLNVQYDAVPPALAATWNKRSDASTPTLPTLPMLTQSVLTLPAVIKLPPVILAVVERLPAPDNAPVEANVHSLGVPKRSVTTVKLLVEFTPGLPVALALPNTRLPVAVVTLMLPVTSTFPATLALLNNPTLVMFG